MCGRDNAAAVAGPPSKAFCPRVQGPAGALAAWTVQIPGTGACVHASPPSRLKVVTRNEDTASQAMSEGISPKKARAVRRLAHNRVRREFNCLSCIRAQVSVVERALTCKHAKYGSKLGTITAGHEFSWSC